MEENNVRTAPEAQRLADSLIPDAVRGHAHHSVMFFVHYTEIGADPEAAYPTGWIYRGKKRFTNVGEAMACYANTPYPASQHLSAGTEEELERLEAEMVQNFQNEGWLKENLYPYL